jgi:hypothetical protein
LPEFVTLSVPVFAGPLAGWRREVPAALEVDPETETFQLIPLPGAIEAAVCSAEARVGEYLAEGAGEGVGIFYGAA